MKTIKELCKWLRATDKAVSVMDGAISLPYSAIADIIEFVEKDAMKGGDESS